MLNIVVGYDRRTRIPAYVVAESIMRNTSVPVKFTFLHRDMLGNLVKSTQPHDSTEFSTTRFLTPYLSDYVGWSLFLDNDMLIQADIKELFDYADDRYSVMCVKHIQICNTDIKFLGKKQFQYKYKNWSSVMLFNNSKCNILTPDFIKKSNGLDLHQFKWTEPTLIGELPLEWNYLVDNLNQTSNKPKLIHYTEGGPWYPEYQNCEYANIWTNHYKELIFK